MRTSLNEIKRIDDYLLGRMSGGDALLFQANMILNDDTRSNVEHQKATHALITQYSRRVLKAEIKAVQESFTTAPQHRGFMQLIVRIFK